MSENREDGEVREYDESPDTIAEGLSDADLREQYTIYRDIVEVHLTTVEDRRMLNTLLTMERELALRENK